MTYFAILIMRIRHSLQSLFFVIDTRYTYKVAQSSYLKFSREERKGSLQKGKEIGLHIINAVCPRVSQQIIVKS